MTKQPDIAKPTPDAIARAAALLHAGRLVALPTETVYGLGADAARDEAAAAIFEAKGRPRFNPLIVHVANVGDAERIAVFDERAERLAKKFWPGPLTMVLPRRADAKVSWLASAGMNTIAVRCPAHPAAQALLKAFGGPIVAPSANRSGSVSPTTAAHVAESLNGAVDLILDGGATELGLESTIVGLTDPTATMLRPGAVARADIEALLGPLGTASDSEDAPHAPGRLKSHYAPSKPLRLNTYTARAGEALLAFGPAPAGASRVFNLSPRSDLKEAAANLFAMLRAADASDATAIAVMPIPYAGLGEAINDRLARAAAPRDT